MTFDPDRYSVYEVIDDTEPELISEQLGVAVYGPPRRSMWVIGIDFDRETALDMRDKLNQQLGTDTRRFLAISHAEQQPTRPARSSADAQAILDDLNQGQDR
jgi:hypothetical protein